MKLMQRATAFSVLALTLSMGFAADAKNDVDPKIAAQIRTTLQTRFPNLQIEQVHRSPIAGLYELMTPAEIIYSDESGNFVFAGKVLDTRNQQDVTATRWNELNVIDFKTLPLNLAIKTVRGDGSRKLAVFSDPLCPYCRELEQQMEGITNVTIYTFLYPLESLHPGAAVKANSIWCAKERGTVWSSWMLKRVEPAEATCKDSPVSTITALGDKLHINSTPTLFLANGQRSSGALPQADLEKLLATSR